MISAAQSLMDRYATWEPSLSSVLTLLRPAVCQSWRLP
jgi:hypothetical protein